MIVEVGVWVGDCVRVAVGGIGVGVLEGRIVGVAVGMGVSHQLGVGVGVSSHSCALATALTSTRQKTLTTTHTFIIYTILGYTYFVNDTYTY